MATSETIELKIKLDDRASRQLKDIDKALNSLNGRMGGLATSSNVSAGAIGGLVSRLGVAKIAMGALGIASVAVTKAVLNNARAFESVTAQLQILDGDTNQYIATLSKIAKETRSDFPAVVELFTKLKATTGELGFSTAQVEELTTKFSKALVVAGADAQTSAGVIRQFGQAMASGSVRGDEFISISEGLGIVLADLAKESGHTIGSLREMSQKGELTAEVFADMIFRSEEIDRKFDKMSITTDQLRTQLANNVMQLSALVAEGSKVKPVFDLATEALNNFLEVILEGNRAANAISPITKSINKLKGELKALQAVEDGLDVRIGFEEGDASPGLEQGDNMLDFANDLASKYAESYGIATKETEKNTEALTKNQQKIKEIKALIADLESFQRAQTNALKEQNQELDTSASKEEAHRKELLETVYVYGDALKEAMAYKTELQTLEEELRKNQLALHNYNRAFHAGVNRVGEGEEASRKYKEETTALSEAIMRTVEKIAKLKHEMELAANPYLVLIEEHKKLTKESALLSEQLEIAKQKMKEKGADTEVYAYVIAGLEEQIKGVNEELDKFNEKADPSLEEQVNKTLKLNEENEKLFKQYAEGTRTVEQLAEAARILGVEFEMEEELETFKEFTDRMNKASRASVNLTNNQKKLLAELEKQKKAGKELTDIQKHQFETLSKLYQDADDNAFNLAKSVAEAFDKSISSVSGAMADMLLGLGNGFSSLEDIALQTLRSITSALIEAFIRQQILGQSLGAGSAGLLSGVGGLLSAAGPAGIAAGLGLAAVGMFLGRRADGGNVSANRPYLVGERGPELMIPNKQGTIISNEELNAPGNKGDLTVNFNINAIDTQTGTEFLIENKRVITGVVQDAFRRRATAGPLG